MYWKVFASLFAALALFSVPTFACDEAPQETTYGPQVQYVTPPSYEYSEIRYEPEAETVTTPVAPVETEATDENEGPNPGGVGISASFFL